MSDIPERDSDENLPLAPWARGLIAIAIMLGLGGFSQIVAGQGAGQPNSAATPTPGFGANVQAITVVATRIPTRVPTPTRIRVPTRLPDAGTNKNNDMCTVILSEHAARPSVPLCATEKTPQPK